jgi:hypothetical protein
MQNTNTDDFLEHYISRKLSVLEGWSRRLEREIAALKAINDLKERAAPDPKKPNKVEQLKLFG